MKKKKKNRKIPPDLRIDSNSETLLAKWKPRLTEPKNEITRPSDIVKRFRVGQREVLLKLHQLLPGASIDPRTKLPEHVIELVKTNGHDSNFWPTLKKTSKKNFTTPSLAPRRLKKKVKKNQKKKKKKKGSAHHILTPMGGQPG